MALRVIGATTATEATAQLRLQFLRGDRSKEGASGGLRERSSVQGDIVNSTLWYAAEPPSSHAFDNYPDYATNMANRLPMIYVGGNDGMLHGFSAEDGSEKLAYVPRGVYEKLPILTTADYDVNHHYYVDGSPLVGDVQYNGQWRTVLIGTLAGGGKGYFALNVTNPGAKNGKSITSSEPTFNIGNANQLVLFDHTDGSDPDLGHIYGDPLTDEGNPQQPVQLVRTNNDKWAYITGNGVNSANGRPVLYIQYLSDNNYAVKTIVAASTGAEASSNGLFTPRPLDVNGDGKVDVVYAGDMRGNLWKFDLSSANDSQWGVATFNGAAVPLFTAVDSSGRRQPITSAPLIKPNTSVGGLMVAFGTGRVMTDDDRTNTASQSFYAVLDKTRYKPNGNVVEVDTGVANPPVAGRSDLKQRAYSTSSKAGAGQSSGTTFWNLSATKTDPVQYQGSDRGWVLELPTSGERVVQPPQFYDGSKIIEFKSEVPASGSTSGPADEESCGSSPTEAKGWRNLINIETGMAPTANVMDVNGDGKFNQLDMVSNMVASRSTAAPVEMKIAGQNVHKRISSDGTTMSTQNLRKIPDVMLRPNWRQLQ